MRHPLISVVVWGCVAILASNVAGAQARAPSAIKPREERKIATVAPASDDTARAQKLAELEAWLRRLPGTYRVGGNATAAKSYGANQGSRITGVAECIGIGSGPGVQCIIDASWQNMLVEHGAGVTSPSLFGANNNLHPLVLLFGIDSESQGISLLIVDQTAQRYLGNWHKEAPRVGETIRFAWKHGCDMEFTFCWISALVTAKPGAKSFEMKMGSGFGGINMIMNRESKDPISVKPINR